MQLIICSQIKLPGGDVASMCRASWTQSLRTSGAHVNPRWNVMASNIRLWLPRQIDCPHGCALRCSRVARRRGGEECVVDAKVGIQATLVGAMWRFLEFFIVITNYRYKERDLYEKLGIQT